MYYIRLSRLNDFVIYFAIIFNNLIGLGKSKYFATIRSTLDAMSFIFYLFIWIYSFLNWIRHFKLFYYLKYGCYFIYLIIFSLNCVAWTRQHRVLSLLVVNNYVVVMRNVVQLLSDFVQMVLVVLLSLSSASTKYKIFRTFQIVINFVLKVL